MTARLFDRFLASDDQLDIVGSSDFHPVGPQLNGWGQLAAAEATEWQALFDALQDATGRMTMLELGAGFGRWTVHAAAALRRYRPRLRYRFIALEPEPTHYQWLKQHARDNGLRRWSPRGSCKLIEAAVSSRAGRESFYFGRPRDWYGQVLVRPENQGADAPITEVQTITLSSLLEPLDRVDLIDMDIQGAEVEVLSEAAPALDRVRRIHVETHSDAIDEQLPAVLERAAGDWQQEIAIPLGAQRTTQLGDADFHEGGIQLWRNRSR